MNRASVRFGFDQIGNRKGIGGCAIAVDDDFLAGPDMGSMNKAAAFPKSVGDGIVALHVEQARIARVSSIIGEACPNQAWIAAVDGEKIAVEQLLHRLPLEIGGRERLISS